MAQAAKSTETPKSPKQGRSPAYPGIDLATAITKAKALYDAHGKYAVPMPLAFSAWGFAEKSSGGRETRAALKYFGLTVLEGDGEKGKVKLTDKAFRVLLDEREDQSEKQALIREMALAPAIHSRLFQEFPEGIKSDASAEHFLMFEGGYNKAAAAELVTEFKSTATYAGLYKPVSTVDKSVDEAPDNEGDELPPADDKPPAGNRKVKLMESERVVFTEENNPQQYVKLVASGDVDEALLDALQDYVKRQKKRLGLPDQAEPTKRKRFV